MLLITDMESGERVHSQDTWDNSLSHEDDAFGLMCPAAQPEVSAEQFQRIMPALMEHAFGVKR
jgi:hypothetical protein